MNIQFRILVKKFCYMFQLDKLPFFQFCLALPKFNRLQKVIPVMPLFSYNGINLLR